MTFKDAVDFFYRNGLNPRNLLYIGIIIIGLIVLESFGFISSIPFKMFLITLFNLAGLTIIIGTLFLVGAGIFNFQRIMKWIDNLSEEVF